jgi:hypothetical protein
VREDSSGVVGHHLNQPLGRRLHRALCTFVLDIQVVRIVAVVQDMLYPDKAAVELGFREGKEMVVCNHKVEGLAARLGVEVGECRTTCRHG